MSDLNWQDIATVGGPLSPKPVAIASAATIAPTTFLSTVTGTVAVVTVTPPVTGVHMLCLVFTTTTPAAFTTAGNILAVATPSSNIPCFLIYNPLTSKYYVKT